jgi:hypothetical protein
VREIVIARSGLLRRSNLDRLNPELFAFEAGGPRGKLGALVQNGRHDGALSSVTQEASNG